MSRRFRCLNVYTTETEHCNTLSELLNHDKLKKGFHAFYCHGSIISDYHSEDFDPQVVRSASILKGYFQAHGVTTHQIPFLKAEPVFTGKDLFLLTHKAKPLTEFPEKIVLAFGGKLRDTLGVSMPYEDAPGYALYQASVYNLLNESYEKSPIYDTDGIYREYLLWNDNGLWSSEDWDRQINELQNLPSMEWQTNSPTEQAQTYVPPSELSVPVEPLHTQFSFKNFNLGRLGRSLKKLRTNLTQNPKPTLEQQQSIPVAERAEADISTQGRQEGSLAEPSTTSAAEQAKLSSLRLAWLGSGWLSSRLEATLMQNPGNYTTDPCPYPPEIETWAKAALQRLMEYDAAFLAYYRKDQKADLPGWQSWQNYISTLCEFLPYHQARSPDASKGDYLPTNSSGSRGGPRLWQGYLYPQVNMHIRHLLLDGWLTLWPVEDKLYYQPGSLALLYWAAKHADKPYTNTPREFIENYDWNSATWFGGNWEGR